MSLDSVISLWQSDPDTSPNLAVWRTLPPRLAQTRPLPGDLHPRLKRALSVAGIDTLYSHQLAAWTLAREGKSFVLATGTASGKTLAYNLPVLEALMEDEQARALYLFPSKALAQDQLTILQRQLSAHGHESNSPALSVAIYDGDTPQAQRPKNDGCRGHTMAWVDENIKKVQ